MNVWNKAKPYVERAIANPQWLLMFVFGRFSLSYRIVRFGMRQFGSEKSTERSQQPLLLEESLFPEMDIDAAVKALEDKGVARGLQLPRDILSGILDYANATNCYGDRKPQCGFPHAQRAEAERLYGSEFMRGEYFNTLSECPAIQTLARDPKLFAIARRYFGVRPKLTSARLWWNFVLHDEGRDLSEGARTFHYDMDDYRCLACFFYLTDVDDGAGPHVYVKGSHVRKTFRHRLTFFNRNQSDRDIVDFYGADNLVTVCGRAGTGFIEDKFSFHKATSPTQTNRLILYLQFGMFDYGVNSCVDSEALRSLTPSIRSH